MIIAVSKWLRKKAAWRKFWSNMAVFFLLQGMILALKSRLATLAPHLEPPLDYRASGYTPDDAYLVMTSYSGEARVTAAILEVTDCLYSGAYTVLFASLLGLSLAAIGSREWMHVVNLIPLATAIVDVLENCLMLAMLHSPSMEVARIVAVASNVKWRMLAATGSLIAGTGAFCVFKSFTAPGSRQAGRKGADGQDGGADSGSEAAAAGASGGARVRKTARRA